MRVLQLFGCIRGKHLRSRGDAWNDGTTYRSHCVGCGVAMIRRAAGWQVDPDPQPRPPAH